MVGGALQVRTQRRARRTSDPDRPPRVPVEAGGPVRVPPRPWSRLRAWLVLDGFEAGRHTVHVVAGERFDPYRVVRAARSAGHRPRQVLATSRMARAFTAAQLATLVHDRLTPQLHGAHAVTVADPLDMLVTDEVTLREARVLLSDMLEVLDEAAAGRPVLVTQRPHASPLMRELRQATAPARTHLDGVAFPGGGRIAWGPTRQTRLEAFRTEVVA